MIKRLGKAKKGKQGAILIFVVLILALAMIFISAAMMLTSATRDRLYESTMTTQARLTCTSAVEVFLEALETQEITDDQISGNIKTYHGSDKIRMVCEGVPGMSASGNDNCTFLDLYYPNASDHNTVNADFTTTIGDETECIRVVLSVDNSGPNYGNRFRNQIEVSTSVQTETMRFYDGVGMWNTSIAKPTDNTILLRGNATDSGGGGAFYSDVVFAPGQQSHWGSSNKFYGNIIFLQGAKFYSSHSDVYYSGDIYFVGSSSDDAGFLYSGGDAANQYNSQYFPTDSKFVFLNRSVQRSALDDVDDNGSKIERLVKGQTPEGTDATAGKTCYFVTYDEAAANMTDDDNPYRIVFKSTGDTNTNTRHGTAGSSYTVDNGWSSTINYTSPASDMVDVNNNLRIYSASDYCNVNTPFPSDVSTVFANFSPDGYETAGASGVVLGYDTYLKDGTVVPAGDTIPAGAEYEATPLTSTFPSWLRTGGSPTGTIPSTYKFELSSSNLGTTATSQGHSNYVKLAPKYYYFTSGGEVGYQSSNDPYVICIDGSNASSYRFYFQGNTVFDLGAVVFAIYNVTDETTPIVFILEPGAQIHWGGANYRETGNICNSGIISVQHVNEDGDPYYSDASGIATFIRGTAYTDEITDWGGYVGKNGTIEYPYAYDSIRRPTAYVFGAGTNEFRVGDRCMLEAYIGLYGGGCFGFNNCNEESKPIYIYGRVETTTYGISGYTGSPGGLCMPYCPQPGGVEEGERQTGRAVSKYHVADLIYYKVLPTT